MANRETIRVTVAGHQLMMTVEEEEREHVERAAKRVTDSIQRLQGAAGATASPAKIAVMAAFQSAFDLSVADEMLQGCEHLQEELAKQKEAVKRLESLLSRVDDALAY